MTPWHLLGAFSRFSRLTSRQSWLVCQHWDSQRPGEAFRLRHRRRRRYFSTPGDGGFLGTASSSAVLRPHRARSPQSFGRFEALQAHSAHRWLSAPRSGASHPAEGADLSGVYCTRSLFQRTHLAVATTPGGTVGCECRSPSPTAAAFPVSQAGRLPHCAFSRPAQRSLLVTAYALAESNGPFSIRSFDRFVTSTAVPIATGWNDPYRVRNCTH